MIELKKSTKAKRWNWQSSDYLCAEIAEHTDTVVLSFSMGKDSLAAYIQLKRFFKNVHLYYLYLAPNIPFIDANIAYYEQEFGQKIVQLPSSIFAINYAGFLFQPVTNVDKIDTANFYTADKDKYNDTLAKAVKAYFNASLDTPVADGVRADDNLNRRSAIVQYSPYNFNRNQFRPVYDWSKSDCFNEIRKAGIKLPVDYQLWGRTFEGYDYKFIKGLKMWLPESYEVLRSWYPFIELEILRYENPIRGRAKELPNQFLLNYGH